MAYPAPCTIWKTNSKQECIQQLDSYASRDVAESVMVKWFKASECTVDFLILDSNGIVLSAVFSTRSLEQLSRKYNQ